MSGLIGGALLGGLGMGMNAIASSKAQSAAKAEAQRAQEQNQILANRIQAESQQRQFETEAAMEDARRRSILLSQQKSAAVGPTMDTSAKNISSILTSPLGDPSEPNVGRKRLLSPPTQQGVA